MIIYIILFKCKWGQNQGVTKTLILDTSSFLGAIYGVSIVTHYVSSSSSGGSIGAFFLRLPEHFPVDDPGGSGLNLTSGINGICLASSTTMVCDATYTTVYSIMRVGDEVTTPDSATVLLLEMEITMLCGKLT